MVRALIVVCLVSVVLYLLYQILALSSDNLHYLTQLKLGTPPLKSQTASESDRQNVLKALKNFFRDFKDPGQTASKRIDDYSIDKIDNLYSIPGGISFKVFFSVKPVQSNSSFWLSGEGVKDDKGWVRGKTATGKALQVDEQYYIVSLDINSTTQIVK